MDHSNFHYVGRSALDGGVDGFAFFAVSHHYIDRVGKVREISPSAEHGFDISLPGSQNPRIVEISFYSREVLKIFLNEILGFSQCQIGGAAQPKGAHAIDQSEIDCLGMPALLLGYFDNGTS